MTILELSQYSGVQEVLHSIETFATDIKMENNKFWKNCLLPSDVTWTTQK
jgi:hypothetical protein